MSLTLQEYFRNGGLGPDRDWSRGLVEQFPRSWQARLMWAWRREHRKERRTGNLSLLARVRKLADSARGGIRPDASDADICQQADTTARDFVRRLQQVEAIAKGKGGSAAAVVRLQAFYCRALLRARGLLDLWPARKYRPSSLRRVQCAKFWRRVYRKLHARTVEACAIGIGFVRSTAGLYASDDSVHRRAGQNMRNAASLDAVYAANDHGQAYTLAELAAKGTANKAIRRQELLTRIAGFEFIAKDMGHVGCMVTTTCPSRFHKCTTRADGRVVDNSKWDGSTPDEGQSYLSKQWQRCRAAAARAGLEWYGFRIAEPQHDGTPHWHTLLFMRPGQFAKLQDLFKRYFLDNESPHEPGAQKHRVDFEPIDWAKGSAVGYVIKYVSKNIDGHGVGLDLFGNDAITSSQRVEAWASTWRIRQFQQVGGPPVGVWRELRRINPEQRMSDAPDALQAAMSAINVGKLEPGVQSLAWAKYTAAQGGVFCKRKAQRLRLFREQSGECGRYGDVMAPKVLGVDAAGVQFFRNHIHEMKPDAPLFQRKVFMRVESERGEWVTAMGKEAALRAAATVFQRSGEAVSTRIHVNNCTRPDPGAVSSFSPVVVHRRKLRRFHQWEPKPGRSPGAT